VDVGDDPALDASGQVFLCASVHHDSILRAGSFPLVYAVSSFSSIVSTDKHDETWRIEALNATARGADTIIGLLNLLRSGIKKTGPTFGGTTGAGAAHRRPSSLASCQAQLASPRIRIRQSRG